MTDNNMSIFIDETCCIGCGSCVLLCPEEALIVSASFVVELDRESCTECLTCLDCCPNEALEEPHDG